MLGTTFWLSCFSVMVPPSGALPMPFFSFLILLRCSKNTVELIKNFPAPRRNEASLGAAPAEGAPPCWISPFFNAMLKLMFRGRPLLLSPPFEMFAGLVTSISEVMCSKIGPFADLVIGWSKLRPRDITSCSRFVIRESRELACCIASHYKKCSFSMVLYFINYPIFSISEAKISIEKAPSPSGSNFPVF